MLNKNMRSMYYLTVHIQKQESWFVYTKFKHNKCHICNFNAKSGFPLFFKNYSFVFSLMLKSHCIQLFPFSMRKLFRVGK